MATIPLTDIQAGFGGSAPGERDVVPAETIVRELERHRVARALVRITPEASDFDILRSNDRLYSAAERFSQLIPCPTVAPNTCGDLPDEEDQLRAAVAARAGAVIIRPGVDCWQPERWVCGALMQAVETHRMPVMCLERMVPAAVVANLAEAYPRCPFIVGEVSYRTHRTLMALMKAFPNVYLSIGNNFTAHRGVEMYVRELGPERLLFGTGLPDSEAGAAIGQLMYSGLSEEHKTLVGHANFDALMKGIR
jgi:predicted TIM-barrel fold metal-dependent hydrolase